MQASQTREVANRRQCACDCRCRDRVAPVRRRLQLDVRAAGDAVADAGGAGKRDCP